MPSATLRSHSDSLDEIVLVAEKCPERHLRVIGRQKERDHRSHADRDGDDRQPDDPAPLVRIQPSRRKQRRCGTIASANQTVSGDSA